jgi:hypothetical protein
MSELVRLKGPFRWARVPETDDRVTADFVEDSDVVILHPIAFDTFACVVMDEIIAERDVGRLTLAHPHI